MSEKIDLSIIIPVYNVEKHLYNCLASLEGINDIRYEIILVNDGSTDNSLDLAVRYSNVNMDRKNIKVISQDNVGLAGARNTGMKYAVGEYILFVDSDDLSDGKNVEAVVKKAQKDKVDLAIANYNIINEIDEKTGQFKGFVYHRVDEMKNYGLHTGQEWLKLMTDIRICYCAAVWDTIYRKDFLLDNNISFITGRLVEDEIFMVETLLKAKRVNYYDYVIYSYFTVWSGTLSREKSLKKCNDKLLHGKDIFDMTKDYSSEDKIKKTIFYHGYKLMIRALVMVLDNPNVYNQVCAYIKQCFNEYRDDKMLQEFISELPEEDRKVIEEIIK